MKPFISTRVCPRQLPPDIGRISGLPDHYGITVAIGQEPISLRRLAARPVRSKCRDCKEAEERLEALVS